MAEGKPNTALGSGDGGAESSSSSFTMPGLSDGFNDPILMPMSSSRVGTHINAAESEESTPPTSAESTPHGTPSKPPRGRAAPSTSATGRAGAASRQGQADELDDVAAKARRREFYGRTAKGFIIPREDIPDTPKEKGESNRKHVSKAIEEGIRAEYRPSRPSAVACGENHPEAPEGGEGEECCTVRSTARSRIKDEEDQDESSDNKFGLYLRVSSSDIRQDETGPPYQVYVVNVWHGRKTWSLERPLGAFYALGERLQGKVSPDVLPPSLPQRPTGGGWLKGLSMASETKEDRVETTKLLDSYVSSLAGLARRLEREVSVGAADAESLMHLVHCLYEFVDFVEASGSYRSRLKLSDSTAAPGQESSQTEEIEMPGAIQLEAGEDAEIETMLSLSLELQRLQEMLKEVEEKGRQEAKVKRDMGGAVVCLTEELKELQAAERLLKGRVDEAIRGPHRNEGDAEILSSLRQRLWRARASRLYEVLAPGCGGGESGADASGYNDPMPIGATDRAGEGGGDIDGGDAEGPSPGRGSGGQRGVVGEEMGALEEEAMRLFSPPLDGGRGKDKLLSVQGAQLAAENVKLWGSLVGLASSWIKVRETSQQVTGWKSSKQVTFAKTPSPFDLISDEASQPKSPCLSFETRLPGSAESTGSRASSKGWPKGEEDCARPPADVVLRIASSMFQCMDGLRSQLSRELRQVMSLKEDSKSLSYALEVAKKELATTRAEKDAHAAQCDACDTEIRRLSGLKKMVNEAVASQGQGQVQSGGGEGHEEDSDEDERRELEPA